MFVNVFILYINIRYVMFPNMIHQPSCGFSKFNVPTQKMVTRVTRHVNTIFTRVDSNVKWQILFFYRMSRKLDLSVMCDFMGTFI